VLTGSAWVLGGRLLLGISILLQSAILARLLGPHDLGVFLLVQSIVLPASLFAVFGLDLLAMRELRDPRSATNTVSPLSFLMRGGVLIVVAAGLVAAIILVGMGAGCGLLLADGCGLAPELAPVLWPLIALSAFQLLLSGILRALGRMGAATFLAGVLSVSLVLCATAVAAVLRLDLGFRAVLNLQVAALAIAVLASAGFLRGIEHASRGGAAPFRQFVRTGPLLLTTQLLALLVSQSDVWVFGLAATPEQIAQYGLAARLAQLVSLPHLVLNGVLPPLMASRVREQQRDALERVIRMSVAAATVPALGLALLFLFGGGEILAIAFGGIYRDAAPVLAILAAGNVVNVVCGPCSQLLIMSGHQRTLNLITLVNCVFCLGAGALAAVHLGALGVAAVYALALTAQGIAGAWAAARLVGVRTHAGPAALGDAAAALSRMIRDAR
jgi:O-antigen/teichoic acid export membrane protein